MHPSSYDVLISGAGPAGCACAISLARSGLSVALLDKSSFPRDKICGDALSPDVVNQLALLSDGNTDMFRDFLANSKKTGTHGISFISPNGRRLDIPVSINHRHATTPPDAAGYIMTRYHFDSFLHSQAINLPNLHFIENAEATEAKTTKEGIALDTSRGPVTGKVLVVAEGAQSRLARQLAGVSVEHRHYCAGLRQYWQGVTMPSTPFIELHFIKDLLPGYFWIFPLPDGRANVGLGMLSAEVKKQKLNLRHVLEQIINEHPDISPRFRNASPEESPRGWGLPIGSKRRVISGNRFLLCGDAASLIDPFTGEGIGNAIRSGRVAADTIMACHTKNDFTYQALKAYDAEVYRRMGKELMLSRKMQQLLRFPWLFDLVVKKAEANPSVRSLITVMLTDLDIKKELISPRFYLKLITG